MFGQRSSITQSFKPRSIAWWGLGLAFFAILWLASYFHLTYYKKNLSYGLSAGALIVYWSPSNSWVQTVDPFLMSTMLIEKPDKRKFMAVEVPTEWNNKGDINNGDDHFVVLDKPFQAYGFVDWNTKVTPHVMVSLNNLRQGGLILPIWLPFLGLSLTLMSLIYRRQLIQQRRMQEGLCLNCGYDLRQNSGSCPECGVSLKSHGD